MNINGDKLKNDIYKSGITDEGKPTDVRNVNFEAHITKLNDLGAIQAETLKVLTDMRTAQGEALKALTRICEELILQTQILVDNRAAIGQMEKSVKDKTEKIYNYLKYPNGHSLTAVK